MIFPCESSRKSSANESELLCEERLLWTSNSRTEIKVDGGMTAKFDHQNRRSEIASENGLCFDMQITVRLGQNLYGRHRRFKFKFSGDILHTGRFQPEKINENFTEKYRNIWTGVRILFAHGTKAYK